MTDKESSSEITQPVRAQRSVPSVDKTQPTRVRNAASSVEKTRPVRLKGTRQLSSSLWKLAGRRLMRNPEALLGLFMIVVFILIAICADWLAPHSPRETNLKLDHLPPAWVSRSATGASGDLRFPLGTDRMGRDLLSWGIYGTRTSMLLGLISAPIIGLIGMLIGLLSGYAGGRVDNWVMRLTDVVYAFPPIMITILIVLALRDSPAGMWLGGLFMFFLAFLTVGWAGAARLVRASVLAVKEVEYIEAARCIGVPALRLVFKHILPNCLGPLLVWVTLMVPQLILTEAVLGYLQINTGPAFYREALLDTSWGGMIRDGRSVIHIQPVTILIPALGVGLISIAFTFLGDALRDALDPQNQEPTASS